MFIKTWIYINIQDLSISILINSSIFLDILERTMLWRTCIFPSVCSGFRHSWTEFFMRDQGRLSYFRCILRDWKLLSLCIFSGKNMAREMVWKRTIDGDSRKRWRGKWKKNHGRRNEIAVHRHTPCNHFDRWTSTVGWVIRLKMRWKETHLLDASENFFFSAVSFLSY